MCSYSVKKINTEISGLTYQYISQFKVDVESFLKVPAPPGGFTSWKCELSID